jgi:hypothetical protein
MRNLRKKIATVTEEEATKELADAFLEDAYNNIDYSVDWVFELFKLGTDEFPSFEEYFEKSESEQMEILEDLEFETIYKNYDNSYLLETIENIAKNKNLSDEEIDIYYDAYFDAAKKASSDKQYLETFRKKVNKRKDWNTKNNVNPDFNKGINKINCIRVRLQKKLS